MTRVLVTRPEPDAEDTAGRLVGLGLEPVVHPLMRMEVTDAVLPDAAGLSGLIATSANAIRVLFERKALGPYLGLPLYAVGEKTAAMARAAGFAQIEVAGGDADALIGLMGATAPRGTYFYPSAAETARDLPKALSASGREIIAAQVYRMVSVDVLDDETARQLAAGDIAAVLCYSRHTAHLFADLAQSVLGPDEKRALTLICLSENVAAPLVTHGFVRIILADFPSEEAMMAATLSFSRGQITS